MQISLSEERIRQVCNEIDLPSFYEKLENDYSKIISEEDYHWLQKEVALLSVPDRTKKNVIRRKIVIQYLHDNLKMSFFQIGRLLKRHHTSVINLYKQI